MIPLFILGGPFQRESNAFAGFGQQHVVAGSGPQRPLQPADRSTEPAARLAAEEMHAEAGAVEPGHGTVLPVGNQTGCVAAGEHD
jgi:hypothetical protein